MKYPYQIRNDAITAVGAPSTLWYLTKAIYWMYVLAATFNQEPDNEQQSNNDDLQEDPFLSILKSLNLKASHQEFEVSLPPLLKLLMHEFNLWMQQPDIDPVEIVNNILADKIGTKIDQLTQQITVTEDELNDVEQQTDQIKQDIREMAVTELKQEVEEGEKQLNEIRNRISQV